MRFFLLALTLMFTGILDHPTIPEPRQPAPCGVGAYAPCEGAPQNPPQRQPVLGD